MWVNAGGVDFPFIYIHHSNIASVPFVTVRNVYVETMLCITFPSKFERPRRVLTLCTENMQSYGGFRIQAGLLSGKGRVLFKCIVLSELSAWWISTYPRNILPSSTELKRLAHISVLVKKLLAFCGTGRSITVLTLTGQLCVS